MAAEKDGSGTRGVFVVEVLFAATGARSIARRFKTEEEGRDFYTRSVNAYVQKANRERVRYVVAFYRTRGPRSTQVCREIESRVIDPH